MIHSPKLIFPCFSGMDIIRGRSSTDESLLNQGGRTPERTRSTSHTRERKHAYIYV